MKRRLAITGANGFVGRHLTETARSRGWDVTGLVRSDEGARVVRETGGQAVVLEKLGGSALAGAFSGASAVAHLAQIGAERGGATYAAVNVRGTHEVIEAAGRAGVRRLVLLSGLGVAHYGVNPRCTNGYFRSKLAAELALFESDLEAVVFRPSYILGPGGELIPYLLDELAEGDVELVGSGDRRMQPIDVRDVSALILAAATRVGPHPIVLDLVGPEPISYRDLVERVARIRPDLGKGSTKRLRSIPVAEAEGRARAGGYRGMLSDELDCLLCDEVASPERVEKLLGRPLTPLDDALALAVAAALPAPPGDGEGN